MPLWAISSISASVRPSPCSMVSAPARRAAAIPSLPIAWAATFLPMRFVHDGLCFFIGEIHHRVQHPVAFKMVAAVGVILDPIGAVHRLFADGLARAVGSIHVLHTGRNL